MNDPTEDQLAGLSLTDRELFERLGWFNRIRWLAAAFAATVVVLCWHVWGLRFSGRAVAAVLMAVCIYNAALIMFAQSCYHFRRVTRQRIVILGNAQIALDLLAVVVLVHYTGGINNLFLTFMVFPLIIASELLERWNAYLYAGFASVLVHGMAWGECYGVVPHVPIGNMDRTMSYHDPFHVLYICAVMTVVFFAVVFFASTIAGRLRWREEQLEHAYRELSQADTAKSYFMHRVSHELRAPLTAVYSMLKVISEGLTGLIEPKQADLIHRSEIRLRNLVSVVDDLLRYSQIREAPAGTQRQPVDLQRVGEQVCALTAQPAADKQLTLEKRLVSTVVTGDQEELTEMLSNLVSNAVRYTPAGGTLRVEVDAIDNEAVITVSDTGIGIDSEALGHIFDEFYRAPDAKSMVVRGTGLGLSIVRQVVEKHSGRIKVDSQPGKGTTFTVHLPMAHVAEDQPKREQAHA